MDGEQKRNDDDMCPTWKKRSGKRRKLNASDLFLKSFFNSIPIPCHPITPLCYSRPDELSTHFVRTAIPVLQKLLNVC
jgi:hypothetical protein